MKELMKKITFIVSILLFGVLFGFYKTQLANAQLLRNMTIVPPTVDHSLNPGDIAEGKLKIVNDGNTALTFTVSVHDFIVEDTKGTPNLLPLNTLAKKYSAASWIGVTPQTVTVQPNERKELDYFIQIPRDAGAGGHYAAVVFTPTTTLAVDTTGTAVQTTIGTLFYVGVKGQITENATISKFSTPWFQEYGPVTIATQVQNNGDLHIKPQGYITITNMLGKKSYTASLEQLNVFPGAARDFENKIGKKFMFGRYKATVVATYGTANNLQLTKTIVFWVIPWRLILVIILMIAAGVLGYLYWKKNHKDTQNEANKKTNLHESEETAS